MSTPVDDLSVRYRAAMSRLPGGVAVIAARSKAGRDVVAVVTSLVSVSLEPPRVLVVVHSSGRLGELMGVGAHWAATVVGAGGSSAVNWIAEPGRPDVGQLAGIEHHHGEHSGAAVLAHGASWIECRTDQVFDAGDHLVVMASVLEAGLGEREGALVHRLGRIRDTA